MKRPQVNLNILIVEDSITQAQKLSFLLEEQGYCCQLARSGIEALETMRATMPAMVISDVVMPEMDGFEFCKRVKAEDNFRNIPIILLTSLSDTTDIIRGLECGADNFITKPYDEAYLLTRIDYILTNRELRKREKFQIGVEIEFAGKTHFITSERQQILDLLISTYEQAVQINAKLKMREKELEETNLYLSALNAIGSTVSQSLNLDEVLNVALDMLIGLLAINAAGVLLQEDDALILKANKHLPADIINILRKLSLDRELSDLIQMNDKNLASDDARIIKQSGFQSLVCIPLKVKGKIIGIMALATHLPHNFTLLDAELIKNFGNQIAVSIENARLHALTIAMQKAEAEEVLRASERKYRLLFESNPQAMWVYDPETLRFLAVNNTAIAHYGYSREEFLAMTIQDIRSGEDSAKLLNAVAAAQSSLEKMVYADIWQHRKQDGTKIWAEIISHSIEFSGRQARLVLATDITERKLLEEQLRHAQKMESIGTLAGGVAHDFNNILTVIICFTELAMRNIGDPNVRNLLLEVKNAGERAGKLTRQLLAFARKQVLEPKNINLNDVITEVEKFLRRVIGEHIELRFIKEDNLATVHADITQVEQVLMNLCVNARDAMPQGGILLIETHNVTFDRSYCQHHPWAKPGDYVLLSVTDTGIGMDRATQERIFEPFFTTKQLGKGTGLGLAMIYGIVKQHDGLIQVYSEVGHGTTFKIYLPAVTAFAESVKRAPVEKELSGQETILVAEDEPPLRSLIAIALQSEGYKVIMATNGEEATRLFNENETAIDLVLSDAVMPKMGGQELYEILYTRKPSLKFIFMSGYSVNAMNEKFIINEHLDLLPKPFDPVALLSKIREVLNRNN